MDANTPAIRPARAEDAAAMDVRVEETLPSDEEYNGLRRAVGWGTYDAGVAASFLPRSLYCVCAHRGLGLVGMARVVGDGGLVFSIQDVIVLPEHQGQGIGAMLMDAIMGYVRAHACRGSVVSLMSAKGKEGFYERYGFVRRPNDRLGSGMTI
jgi:GNAT superfamily N-acetyltransferase